MNKIKISHFLFTSLIALISFTIIDLQAQQLSEQAKVSLLTCGAGTAIYSAFGHSALHISDPANGLDKIYNYGVFDFKTPNFYIKFIRGKLLYKLSTSTYSRFVDTYRRRNRSVYEQTLNMSLAEKQKLLDLLNENLKPENREYKYDFFFDNCSTRIRDILQKAIPNLQYSNSPTTQNASSKTLKDLLQNYIEQTPWVQFGINLILGLPSDQTATAFDQMYLPFYLLQGIRSAKIPLESNEISFELQRKSINKVKQFPPETNPLTHPFTMSVGVLLLLLIYSFFSRNTQRGRFLVDGLLFLFLGILGCFFLFMWFGTDHIATSKNLNMLWAFPLHLPIAFYLFKKNRPVWVRYYFLGTTIVLLLTLAAWAFLPQKLPIVIIPIVVGVMLRSFLIWREEMGR